jgi:hypothetical protein
MLLEYVGPLLRSRVQRGQYRPRASSSGFCPRQLTYRALGVPETHPTPARIGMVFAHGDAAETALLRMLQAAGAPLHSFQREVDIPFKYGVITGHVDALLADTHVVDFKSINTYGFDEVLETGALHEHLTQVFMYIHGLRLEGLPYSDAIVFYMDKNSGRLAECFASFSSTEGTIVRMLEDGTPAEPRPFSYPDPQELVTRGIRAFEIVEECRLATLDRGVDPTSAPDHEMVLPERPYQGPDVPPCSYCPWRGRCWGVLPFSPSADGTAVDLSHMQEAVDRYIILTEMQKEVERELAAVKAALRASLVDSGALKGTLPNAVVQLVPVTKRTVNVDRIPEDVRRAALEERRTLELRVRRTAAEETQAGAPVENPNLWRGES